MILSVIVLLSLASLASGTRADLLSRALTTGVSVVSYPFLKAMTAVGHGVSYTVGLLVYYNAMVAENTQLRHQQAVLLTETTDRAELIAQNRRLRAMLDFKREQPRLTLEPVEIVGGAFEFGGNLIVDRGSVQGIREGMCVMTASGIVGRVTDVRPFVSSVATLQKADCKISAMIRRNRVRGMLHGSGSSLSAICTLDYIDIKDEVRVGDEVVTSPESQFPSGYPIGKVVAIHGGEDSNVHALLKTAEVEPAADLYHLDEVFIVLKDEPTVKELAGESTAAKSAAPAASLKIQTLQQRYAP